jgi:hypothetical protein
MQLIIKFESVQSKKLQQLSPVSFAHLAFASKQVTWFECRYLAISFTLLSKTVERTLRNLGQLTNLLGHLQ